jgi:hypothetical protein
LWIKLELDIVRSYRGWGVEEDDIYFEDCTVECVKEYGKIGIRLSSGDTYWFSRSDLQKILE